MGSSSSPADTDKTVADILLDVDPLIVMFRPTSKISKPFPLSWILQFAPLDDATNDIVVPVSVSAFGTKTGRSGM
uniref:Uncharacterized protein n=1 Tax=viral metagenome TaxID=1070528 RepID=A0A6M3J7W2_9ZZZZ